ncbi:virulence factor family protein [Pseudomonas sp. ZM23]|uniref:Virulence factor family protein n=1 Tax=Pseudomonas triclosanedens TaxID=2961893 RepID=A0ABY6ZTT8_9PSED|nr:AcvB/VirJ family lysyl-phosphatidylglycerol hydrolase [Pseudomonas triclosanedens]MCP8463589.1 virulence factor family protein [Pseudomonas triclosanedens]MCP8469352.1 virulence factor family protein [Pseudomonas triclosanedens]MCP8474390.1 virulence factor family protein [Pseudomonas triclosanedens]WAI48226.1 virulence factor family protein [Pseudomonas triclosanedens]
MLKRRWRHLLALLLLVIIAMGLLLWSRPASQAALEHRQLPDGSAASLATPGKQPNARVLLAVQPDQKLDDGQLLALAHDSGARVVQFVFPDKDCAAQQARIKAATDLLDGQPSLVAGIGPGGAWAWRWLAGQGDDKAKALSVGFSLEKPDCAAPPLPQSAAHGSWMAAWNDNPDDASARFARGLKNAETVITDYDTPLPKVLADQLRHLLQGGSDNVPVVEVPAAKPSETVTLFYSGDGGWRDLDRDVAAQMAELGYPVVGVDALRYFWEHKSPEQSAADLAVLMQHYREKWGAKHFVLAGYSFGADVLPAIYNRLPADAKKDVSAVILLAFARSGSFEIEVQGWLGKAGQEAATGPEMARLPAPKVLCVYGIEEKDESGCTQPQSVGENLQLPGGHHFDENYPALAKRLVNAIRSRQTADDEG